MYLSVCIFSIGANRYGELIGTNDSSNYRSLRIFEHNVDSIGIQQIIETLNGNHSFPFAVVKCNTGE